MYTVFGFGVWITQLSRFHTSNIVWFSFLLYILNKITVYIINEL